MNSVDIITDGACSGNPGRGGWAAIIIDGSHHTEYSGADAHTTNNRMELQAAITGLQHAPAQRPLRVITDSQYLINGITKWVKGWQKNDWKTREGQPVENQWPAGQLATRQRARRSPTQRTRQYPRPTTSRLGHRESTITTHTCRHSTHHTTHGIPLLSEPDWQ